MVGYGRVVDVLLAYSEQCAFQSAWPHTIIRAFFSSFWYNKNLDEQWRSMFATHSKTQWGNYRSSEYPGST